MSLNVAEICNFPWKQGLMKKKKKLNTHTKKQWGAGQFLSPKCEKDRSWSPDKIFIPPKKYDNNNNNN